MAKTVVCCPKFKTPQQVTRPDSNHPFWSTERQAETEERVSSVEQILECRNTGCTEKFNIYWYNK
jgi:hypothetical protein